MKVIRRFALLLTAFLGTSCRSEKSSASGAATNPGILATHTAISVDQVPKKLLERLDYPYIRFYRTDVTNKTDRPIRIIWFDGYFAHDGNWTSGNVRNKVLRTADFIDWYGTDDIDAEGWLKPGGVASCLVNWHWTDTPEKLDTKWAYIGVDSAGNDYFTEAIVPDIEPIKQK
jgi:hypothetical protein